MQVKIRKANVPQSKSLTVFQETAVSQIPERIEDVELDKSILDAAAYLGLPPLFIVESWVSYCSSRELYRYVHENVPLLKALNAIRNNKPLSQLVLNSCMYTLSPAERRAIENKHVNEKITSRSGELVERLFESANGVQAVKYTKDGEYVYDVPPSTDAAKYLLDRALGKPTATVETTLSPGKGAAIQNVIILPSNNRGDGPSVTEDAQYLDLSFNRDEEEEEEDGN